MKNFVFSIVALMLAASVQACGSSESDPPMDAAAAHDQTTMIALKPDTTGAAIWEHLQGVDYGTDWDLWPGKGEFYTGNEPHGMLLTTYMNGIALEALTSGAGVMPDGAIIVKENYTPDSTLAAVTVMYKRLGYNAEHSDWFFTKFRPNGDLDQTPTGMPMEGRLGGCQGCHGGMAQNDYLFTGTLGSSEGN